MLFSCLMVGRNLPIQESEVGTMQGWVGRVRRRLSRWSEEQRVCACCGQRVEAREFTCDHEACRVGALEAQAMLAPVHAWPPLMRELQVVWSSPTPLQDVAYAITRG